MESEHYFSVEPHSKFVEKEIEINVLGMSFNIKSASGIFSKGKLDFASRLLIETVFPFIRDKERILDLGCGNGVIGISLALKKNNCFFVLSDVNKRAIEIAKKNKKLLHLENVKVVQSDLFQNIKEKFNRIVCNPPMAIPKEGRIRMIKESYEHLLDGGALYMVARHKKGGNIIEKAIQEVFGGCFVVAKKGGFWVYAGEKKNSNA